MEGITIILHPDGTLVVNGKAYGLHAAARDDAIRKIVEALQLDACVKCGRVAEVDIDNECSICNLI